MIYTLTRLWKISGLLSIAPVSNMPHPILRVANGFHYNMEQESPPIKTSPTEHPKSESNPKIPLTKSSFHVSETQIQYSTPTIKHSRYL